MAVSLVRIDDRLIHGQVIEGWLPVVQANRIIVVSNRVAQDPFQVDLMSLAVPSTVRVNVLSIEDVLGESAKEAWKRDRIFLLFEALRDLLAVVEKGVEIPSVNLGGLHEDEGRLPVTPYLFLGEQDWPVIQKLLDRNIEVETRALPTDDRRPIQEYMGKNGG